MLKELEELMRVFNAYAFAAWEMNLEDEGDVEELRETLLEALIKHRGRRATCY